MNSLEEYAYQNSAWVLITGFGPFKSDGFVHNTNPSWQAVSQLPDALPCPSARHGHTVQVSIVKRELPVAYAAADAFYADNGELASLCASQGSDPLLIVHVGVAGECECVELEQIAVNEATKLDVNGYCPEDRKCDAAAEAGCRQGTDLDLQAVADHVNAQLDDIATEARGTRCRLGEAVLAVSEDAGRFLCNYIYYKACGWTRDRCSDSGVLHDLEKVARRQTSCVFVHVPCDGRLLGMRSFTAILRRAVTGMCAQRLGTRDKQATPSTQAALV